MFSCFSIWSKGVVSAFLILLFVINSSAQNESIQPELDINTGLQSNAVRCIKINNDGRTWIGTDNGLNILIANTVLQTKIIDVLGHKSIWAIDFFDSLVLIGTRNDGLFIFNQVNGNLNKHYPNSIINLIRKIKIFDSKIYVLSNNGVYHLLKNDLKKIQIESSTGNDFLVDIFQWNNKVFGLRYPNNKVVELIEGMFSETLQKNLENLSGYVSAFSNNNKLVLGGGGTTKPVIIIEKNKPPKQLNLSKLLVNDFIIWDIVFLRDKIVLAIGDTRTNSKGMLLIINEDFSYVLVDASDYTTCVALSKEEGLIYYGTLNKGLFLKRIKYGNEVKEKPFYSEILSSDIHPYSYSKSKIQKLDNLKKYSLNDSCTAINISGDTLVLANKENVKVYDVNTVKQIASFAFIDYSDISHIERINQTIFTFISYSKIRAFNLKKGLVTNFIGVETTIPYPIKFGKQIILLNKEKGFSIITEQTSYPLTCNDAGLAFVNDFTLIGDRLYTLSFNDLKVYKIYYSSRKLVLINSISIKQLVEGFVPKWVLSNGNNLYVANEQGILKCNAETLLPNGYYYWGNYNKIDKPIIVNDSLAVITNSHIHKIAFDEIDLLKTFSANQVPPKIYYPESINENLSFKIRINQPEYLLQNHSLKTLELWQDGKVILTKYTLNSFFNFDDGLKYGSYDLVLKFQDKQISDTIDIILPFSRNPYFFGAISFLVLIIAFLFVKSNFDKRQLNKKILQNRMQIMKQNLNPHFVYNSMNMISSLILEGKSDEAVQVVSDFSQLQRSYLETNNKSQISLSEELDFLNSYFNLQKKRFYEDNNFEYIIDLQSNIDIKSIMIPPLILQPIAENFIKYGVIASKAITKLIRIEIIDNNQVIVGIEDNGIDVDSDLHGLQLGHKLVKERIEIYNSTNGTKIQICFGMSSLYSPCGYRVELKIPTS